MFFIFQLVLGENLYFVVLNDGNFLNLARYNQINLQKLMPALQFLQSFLDQLLVFTEKGHISLPEFTCRPSRGSPADYIQQLAECLQLQDELVVWGLFLVKRAVETKILVPRKCLYRLVTVCFLLGEKFCSDQHHSLQSYSLLSGISIKELVALEARYLQIIDYELMADEREVQMFKRTELEGCQAMVAKVDP